VFIDSDDYDTLGSDSGLCCPDCGNEKFRSIADILLETDMNNTKRIDEMPSGSRFLCQGGVFIKTTTTKFDSIKSAVCPTLDHAHPDLNNIGCMHLEDGKIYFFNNDTRAVLCPGDITETAMGCRWAEPIAKRISDEFFVDSENDSKLLKQVLATVLSQHPKECLKLVGTQIIEADYFDYLD